MDLCKCAPPFTYRFGHVFTRGDLVLRVVDEHGNPVSPFLVSYALFRLLPDGAHIPFGDPARHPVQDAVGEYHPTFRSDDLGQPGDWLLRWTYRECFTSIPVTKDLPFRILDSVLAKDTRDATPRKNKLGWF